MSIFSDFAGGATSLAEGRAQQKEFKTQASSEMFEAGNERISALRAENVLTDEMFSVMAGQSVAFVANGIDPSSPLAMVAASETIKTGEDEAARIRGEGILRSQRRRMRARSLKRAGRAARLAGFVKFAVSQEKVGGKISKLIATKGMSGGG